MRTLIIGAVVLAALAGGAIDAQQPQPLPGPGTGIVPIKGTVDVANTPSVNVANTPSVNAAQRGEWSVAVGNTPTVKVAPPDFLTKGRRYLITWPNGESETITVAQVSPSGWVRADQAGRVRWVNLATARSIEEAR